MRKGLPENLVALLEGAECGVVLSDAAAFPLYANRRGREIIAVEDGLAVRAERLAGADAAATGRLREEIRRLSAPCEAEGGPAPAALQLERPSLRPPIAVVLVPLWHVRAQQPDPVALSVALFLREPDAPLGLDRAARMNAAYRASVPPSLSALRADGRRRSGCPGLPTARRATR